MRTEITLRSAPEVKRLILRANPDYRKRQAVVATFPESGGVYVNSYWDGGTKDEFAVVHIETLAMLSLPTSSHPYFDIARHGIQGENAAVVVDHYGNVTLKTLPDGYALVRTGWFCGKPSTATVYVLPGNLTPALTGGTALPDDGR